MKALATTIVVDDNGVAKVVLEGEEIPAALAKKITNPDVVGEKRGPGRPPKTEESDSK